MTFAGYVRAAGVGSILLALGACSSPAARFYTLGGSDAALRTSAPASFYLEVAPVDMPPQVARNQMVVERRGVEGAGAGGRTLGVASRRRSAARVVVRSDAAARRDRCLWHHRIPKARRCIG